jgi:hypothetical protein
VSVSRRAGPKGRGARQADQPIVAVALLDDADDEALEA